MSTTTGGRSYAGVSQRHKACGCPQAHTAGCKRHDDESAAMRCRCPRAHGERCQHRTRADGKTACGCPWAFVAEIVRAGTRQQATGSGYSSKTAAAKARAEALDILARTPGAAKRGKTLAEHVGDWFAARSEGSKALKPSTRHDYERYVAMIGDAVGATHLRDVDVSTLDTFVRWMRKRYPNSPAVQARAFAVLQAAIRWGYRRGMFASDPTATYDARPEFARKRRQTLQPEQFMRLYRWAEGNGERIAPALWLAVMTGMRRGEMIALRWIDVDLENAVVTVRQNAVLVGREVVVGTPKTAAGDGRRIALDAATIAVLRGIQTQQTADAAKWGDDYRNDAMLVLTDEQGAPIVPSVWTRHLPRLIARYNREREIHALPANDPELERLAKHKGMGTRRLTRIRFDSTLDGGTLPVVAWHSLRHLSASLFLATSQGDLFSVSRRLGHANVSTTTTVYGHEIEQLQHTQSEAAAAALTGATSTTAERAPDLAQRP